jgi:flagellar biosynthetic protein FliR
VTGELAALAEIGRDPLWGFFLVFVRVGAAMAVLPAFGEQPVPMRVRLALALAFSGIVAPAAMPLLPAFEGPLAGQAALLAAEASVGLILGLGLRLFVLALQMAGAIAAQSVSLSQIFGGSAGADPQPAIGFLLTIAGLALAVMADLHVHAAAALIGSYAPFPPGVFPQAALVASWGTFRVSEAFATGFTLAAPFVVASLVYNVALGVINRAMPQLMVSFVGAPVLTFGGLALLLLSAPMLLQVWLLGLERYLAAPFGAP